MKLAITSQGKGLNDEVDTRFGRAKHFILVDTETDAFSVHDNTQNLNAAQGAGIQAARNVVKLDAQAVVTGNVGPKAFSVLQAGNVDIHIGGQGTVAEALAQFKAGKFDCVSEANVEGHWV